MSLNFKEKEKKSNNKTVALENGKAASHLGLGAGEQDVVRHHFGTWEGEVAGAQLTAVDDQLIAAAVDAQLTAAAAVGTQVAAGQPILRRTCPHSKSVLCSQSLLWHR